MADTSFTMQIITGTNFYPIKTVRPALKPMERYGKTNNSILVSNPEQPHEAVKTKTLLL